MFVPKELRIDSTLENRLKTNKQATSPHPGVRQEHVDDGSDGNEDDTQWDKDQLDGEVLMLKPGHASVPHGGQMLLAACMGDELEDRPNDFDRRDDDRE
ncbi:hypothetical protein PoB_005338400 [Plakobranchus ocellatus]|uniref:Uncharacterized protein n=1 Tax=Plakobranchus ocellatus TaxID=259542 RepID=A0AAV4C847_9GAST|nr:hypothetical protein PoB_005338400 [Plakobranchus ocellatus]